MLTLYGESVIFCWYNDLAISELQFLSFGVQMRKISGIFKA